MTQGFDEWRNTQRTQVNGYTERDAFNAGQQSKQAEVDELRKRVDEALTMLGHSNGYGYEQCSRLAINILKGDQP